MFPRCTTDTRHPAQRTLSESLRVDILDGTTLPGEPLPTEFDVLARSKASGRLASVRFPYPGIEQRAGLI